MNAFIFAGCYFVGFATLVSATFGNKLNSDFRQLGISTETKASKFSGVVDSNNVHRMLRIDKFDVPPYEVSAEVETIRYLSSLKVAPGLVSNLFLPTNAKTGKRHTVTESFGQTLKQRVVTLGTLTEVEAAELTAQVARALKTLTSAGYNHNGIDYESIAFTGTEPDSDLLFVDLTEAKPVRVTDATLGFLKYDLSPEKVYSRFVERDYPGTDRPWFTSKAIHDDSIISEFLPLAWGDWSGWSAETKAAIRNSRIVAGLGTGDVSRLNALDSVRDLWQGVVSLKVPGCSEASFMHMMTEERDWMVIARFLVENRTLLPASISNLILATRALFLYTKRPDLMDYHNFSSGFIYAQLSGYRVEEEIIMKRFPWSDRNWFPRAAVTHYRDDGISEFIRNEGVSLIDKIYLRNSRIYERLATRGHTAHSSLSLDLSVDEIFYHIVEAREPGADYHWFHDLMKYMHDDNDLYKFLSVRASTYGFDMTDQLIVATRMLYRFQRFEKRLRNDYAGVVKVFFQLQGLSSENSFWSLLKGKKAEIERLSHLDNIPVSKLGRNALKLAWNAFQGYSPDLGALVEFFDNHNEPFAVIKSIHRRMPVRRHKATVIFLHGMTSVATEQLELLENQGFFEGLEDVKIVAPQVENTPLNPRVEWFPFARTPWEDGVGSVGSRDGLDETLETLLKIVDEEAALLGGDYGKVFVFGLSKGGMMASWLGLMANRPFGGVINYIGCFPLLELDSVSQHGKTVRYLHFHDDRDTIVPMGFAKAGFEAARRAGAAGYVSIDPANLQGPHYHGLDRVSLAVARDLITSKLVTL